MDRFFSSNTAMKGIAFLIALMLWMIVTLNEQGNPSFQPDEEQLIIDVVGVDTIYDEERYTILDMDDTVQVILTGRRTLLNLISIRQDSFNLFVDLTGLGEGSHRVPVKHQGFPEDIGVTIIPHAITVTLDRKETRTYPVEIEFTGQLPEGYTVGQPTITPPEVELTAARTFLDKVDRVRGIVDLGQLELDRDDEQRVRLEALGEEGQLIEAAFSPETVKVQIPVDAPSIVLPVKLDLVNQLPEGLSIVDVRLETETAQVTAPQEVLNQLEELRLNLDLSTVNENGKILLDIKRERGWQAVQPEQIAVDVQVAPTRERLITQLPIVFVGLAEDKRAEVIQPEEGRIQMTVLGSQTRLDRLERREIRTWVDVEGLEPGIHRLPVEVELPPYLEAEPTRIEVDIQISNRDETAEGNGA